MNGVADFSAQIWLTDVLVEDGKSEQDLKDKLAKMTLQDMLEEGIVKDIVINRDVEIKLTKVRQKISVYNIDYNLEDVNPEDREKIFKSLPKTYEFEIEYNPSAENLEDYIDDELYLNIRHDVEVNKYDYEIVETK